MYVSIIFLFFSTFLFILFLCRQRPKNFPPGPPALPIVGNLLSLNLNNPLKDIEKLRNRYGDVYSLLLGGTPAVVVSGLCAIKEALITKAADFAGRPKDVLITDLLEKGLALADYGPAWREHRRFALTTLKNFGMGKLSMEQRILEEIQHTIGKLEKSIGGTFDPQAVFHNLASNIICQVVFGTRHTCEDDFTKVVIESAKENSKIYHGPWALLYDSIPMVRHLPLPFTKAFKNKETSEKLVNHLITEHKNTRVPGRPRDFLDCYLENLGERAPHTSTLSEERLATFALDLHFGGTDTVSNTLLSGFLYLMTCPLIQERCQQEIDQVLEERDDLSYEHRHNMPYTQAVIHEIQRVANVGPLSIFHCTTKDTQLMGYALPKGTLVIPNLTSVLNEEGRWKFPHEFNPGNFLNERGEFVKPEAFMAFSAGARACPGESLARMELFLITVTLLRRFSFIWPQEAGQPDLQPVFGLTMSPKPYRSIIQLRASPERLQQSGKEKGMAPPSGQS